MAEKNLMEMVLEAKTLLESTSVEDYVSAIEQDCLEKGEKKIAVYSSLIGNLMIGEDIKGIPFEEYSAVFLPTYDGNSRYKDEFEEEVSRRNLKTEIIGYKSFGLKTYEALGDKKLKDELAEKIAYRQERRIEVIAHCSCVDCQGEAYFVDILIKKATDKGKVVFVEDQNRKPVSYIATPLGAKID